MTTAPPEHEPASTLQVTQENTRDWTSIREWTNLAIGLGTFCVGVVSVWTTVQISGLEDYLHSEISRRNTELSILSERSQRTADLADTRAQRLENLQSSTDRIIAASFVAQSAALKAEADLTQIRSKADAARAQILAARQELGALHTQNVNQQNQIDLFQRRRVYEEITGSLVMYAYSVFTKEPASGLTLYNRLLLAVDAGRFKDLNDASAAAIRVKATCYPLQEYNPKLPEHQEYPKYPQMPGQRINTSQGPAYRMTKAQSDDWDHTMKIWNESWEKVSSDNTNRIKLEQKIGMYLSDSLSSCLCRGLATNGTPAAQICGKAADVPVEQPTS